MSHMLSASTLGTEHRDAIFIHLLRLSEDDRRNRFMSTLTEKGLRDYVKGINFVTSKIFGVFICQPNAEPILAGVAHLSFDERNKKAEIALSVEACYRRSGCGIALIRAATDHTKEIGYKALTLCYFQHNIAMQKMARKQGFILQTTDDDSCQADLVLS